MQYRPFDATAWRDWALLPGSATQEYIYPVLQGVVYVCRIRSENRGLGIVSPWVYSDPTAATGDTTEPAEPTGFTAAGAIGGIVLEWTNPGDTDFDRTEIFESTTNTPDPGPTATPLATVFGPTDTYFRSGLSGGAVRFYWIRAVDTSGNKSDWVGPMGATVAESLTITIPTHIYTTTGGDVTNEFVNGIVLSEAVYPERSGGVPTFSYLWESVSNAPASPVVYAQYPTSLNTNFTIDFVKSPYDFGNETVTAVFRLKVTDSSGTIAYSNEITVVMNWWYEEYIDEG